MMEMTRTRLVLIIAALMMGAAAGIGGFTFIYAKGASYLTNDPAACANCHAMNDQYNGWAKSSHHAVAVCNDCHTPHNFVGKWLVKGRNGFFHSLYFTTGGYPDNIQITKMNKSVAEANCRRCHADVVQAMDGPHQGKDKLSCIACHGSVGHR